MATGDTAAPGRRRLEPRTLAVVLTLAVCAAVVVTVLLLSRGPSSGGGPTVGSGSVAVGATPPPFSGTALDGSSVSLAALRGHPVVVNFFATWCDNCREELPLLQRTYQRLHGDGLDIVTVDFNDSGDVQSFLRPFHITFPALLDPDSAVGHAYGVSDLPVSVFIGRDGRVAQVFHGQLSDQTLADALGRIR